ncbi:sugar phosphate isomerase/epimerase family protein [Maribellus maritimus]|uniref:sugar phosphate isomerase/epimerase family protein n=1 Tax=Maribellus maritimus TaxID=2870838 RepID=UPI001EE9DDDF|nr:sugar phosphate isomerase/epimerase family protein [Maribellus maritimus]MCG6190606.1 sugar phosphate isomerase/epimerase [Maribellus maritimus]
MTHRRNFLKAAGIGLAVASVPKLAGASVSRAVSSKSDFNFNLGVASYSLRNFSQEEALNMTLRCGINRITFKSMHLPLDSDNETIKKAVALCRKKGVTLYGGGVIYMKEKKEVDQAFEYAKTAGMEMIIGVPNHELLDYVEEKVKDYNIKLAIHNHGPGDKLYPSAESAYDKIKDRDKRMGLCIDIGHTKRINRDPEQDLKDFFDRVFDIHIKDVTKAASDGKTCIIGRGVIDFSSFLKAVDKSGYKGTLALEYEADGDDPLPGMMESFGYIKGVMRMM